MTAIFLFCFWISYAGADAVHSADQSSSASCSESKMTISKYTLASSDSYRDLDMVQLIFPSAIAEPAPKSNDEQCARESKVFLPFSCFKIHAPQTKRSAGYLPVETLEHEYTKKFYSVIHGHSEYNYDAFFDNNIAFWVRNLDTYLQQINDNHQILTSYIGLQWYHLNTTFYSLIIQSPESQSVFEFISFNEPHLSLYKHLRSNFEWKETTVIRASFKQYPIDEYPWTGMKHIDIVPIRISYACADIEEQMDFYLNVMEATVLYSEMNVIDSLDSVQVSYAFLAIPTVGTPIEIQYVERPIGYTYGTFTTEMYKELLIQTHNHIISSAFCGVDRWMDNHFAMTQTRDYEIDDYLYFDRILEHVRHGNMSAQYRIYWTEQKGTAQQERLQDLLSANDGRTLSTEVGRKYKLFIFDNNGQAIQVIGYLMDSIIEDVVPMWNKRLCFVACPRHQQMGTIDKSKVYTEDQSDTVWQIIFGDGKTGNENHKSVNVNVVIISVVCVGVFVIGLFMFFMRVWYKRKVDWANEETQPLLQHI